jgi:hypothetical protein
MQLLPLYLTCAIFGWWSNVLDMSSTTDREYYIISTVMRSPFHSSKLITLSVPNQSIAVSKTCVLGLLK